MKLLTKAILNALKKAPLYSTDGKDKAPIIVKFFCPWNQWTWYAVEGSPTCAECGSFDCADPTHGPLFQACMTDVALRGGFKDVW